MNQPLNWPELEALISTLIVDAKCACHIINPNKTRILMWKQSQPDGTVIYHLRIGIQKFISQPQQDRNGETYWRYWSTKEENNQSPSEVKETQPHDKSTGPQQSTNEQSN